MFSPTLTWSRTGEGYPALLDILDGPPAGALVFARRAVAGDLWVSADRQMELDHTVIVGRSQRLRYPSPRKHTGAEAQYDRQVRLFGDRGQEILAAQKVAIVGAGGAGSLINEYLARLGVGHVIAVDDDRLDGTNNPRVVGARASDLRPWYRFRSLARLLGWQPSPKVSIAERVAREAKPDIRYEAIVANVVDQNVVRRLLDCDAIFLAADSMQARLVVNAVCHQYLIPTWQVGAKVDSDPTGKIQDVFSVVRQLVPGKTCLWCNGLIDAARLAEEAASPQQRDAQRYVDEIPAPSVITLNAVASAHVVDQYLFATLELQETPEDIHWLKYRSADPISNTSRSKCHEATLAVGNVRDDWGQATLCRYLCEQPNPRLTRHVMPANTHRATPAQESIAATQDHQAEHPRHLVTHMAMWIVPSINGICRDFRLKFQGFGYCVESLREEALRRSFGLAVSALLTRLLFRMTCGRE